MKIKCLSFAAVALLAAACSSTGKSGMAEVETETDAVTDTMVSEPSSAYFSADLKQFGLKGKVKNSMMESPAGFISCVYGLLEFDGAGKLTSNFQGFLDNTFKKNHDGFICSTSCRESDGTTWTLTYTGFDADGRPLSGKYEEDGPDGIVTTEFAYVYGDVDKMGNWMSRKLEGISTARYIDYETGDYGKPEKTSVSGTETRNIEYY